MTRKTHPATGSYALANTVISPIEQIRRGPNAVSTGVSDRVQHAHQITTTDTGTSKALAAETDARVAYSTDTLLLDQLIGWVRSRTRDRYLKEPEVLAIIARSKAAMRRDVSLGLFPAQVKTSIKSSRWRESEVLGWVEATTILSRVANPGFGMKEFVAALMASRISMR
ncbi:hypothetical protein FSO04_12100 [Paraburkholderia madseniana]|uniref:AlpA family phage regulatory protein n=1 Tax=Paraburkholderia madseniana TaxID=2599607 RepID=A0A6N6WHZ0_9BURK|nr:hypothetical protein [Paraburkholderia madseniana]KAE8759641.1 hypothetical protein FSO04_12100 [Paraburkholderia madseniana]